MTEDLETIRFDQFVDEVIAAWLRMLNLKDPESTAHCERTAKLAVQLAQKMGLPEADVERIRRGARLHDIGKVGVPDAILFSPEQLGQEEMEIIRQHVLYSEEILRPVPFINPMVLDMVISHHEHWDGNGYPRGLKGEQIPLAARILAICGVWDALRSDRPYRPAFDKEQAMEIMQEENGKLFDPDILAIFLNLMRALD